MPNGLQNFYSKLTELYDKYGLSAPAFAAEEQEQPERAPDRRTPVWPKAEVVTPQHPLPRREIERGRIPGMGTNVSEVDTPPATEKEQYRADLKEQNVKELGELARLFEYPVVDNHYENTFQGAVKQLSDLVRMKHTLKDIPEATITKLVESGKISSEADLRNLYSQSELALTDAVQQHIDAMTDVNQIDRLINEVGILSEHPAYRTYVSESPLIPGKSDSMITSVGINIVDMLQKRKAQLEAAPVEAPAPAQASEQSEGALEAERAQGTRNIGAPQTESSAGELTQTSSLRVGASQMWRDHIKGKDKLKGLWEVISGKLRKKRIDNAISNGHASRFSPGDSVLLSMGASLVPAAVIKATSNTTYDVKCGDKMYASVEESQLTDLPNGGLFSK